MPKNLSPWGVSMFSRFGIVICWKNRTLGSEIQVVGPTSVASAGYLLHLFTFAPGLEMATSQLTIFGIASKQKRSPNASKLASWQMAEAMIKMAPLESHQDQ